MPRLQGPSTAPDSTRASLTRRRLEPLFSEARRLRLHLLHDLLDGVLEVGVDIQPGTYVSTAADSGNCYWARLSSAEGFDGILDNNNSSGQSLVTVKATDKFFQSSGCNDWTLR